MLFKFCVVALSLSAVFGAVALPKVDLSNERRARATVYSKCVVPNTVALTFDDGPYVNTYDIVKTLDAAGAKGTFFLNGNNYRCIYDADSVKRVNYIHSHGHQLASHTWSHLDLNELSWDKIHNEMWRVEQALIRIVGVTPAFMRPPYGNYNNEVLEASAIRGQSIVLWDFDSQDSVGASPAISKKLYSSLISKRPNTILALNHETYSSTAHEVLPYAIEKLQTAGYRLVTLAECLGQEPYQNVVAPSSRNSSWAC